MNHQPAESLIEDEMNLRDYWRILVRRRALILSIVAVAVVATAVWTLLQPNIYRSEATLMPLGQSASGLRATLGELSGLLPSTLGGNESPAERILAVLQSRTLAEDVINYQELLPRLFADDWDTEKQQWQTNNPPSLQNGVRALRQLAFITADKKTGIIRIAAEHTDPELAAGIANQYVGALQRTLNANAFTLAKKNRLFIAAQLRKTKKDLATAEESLQRFEEKHGIVALEAQAEAAIEAIALLKGEVMAKEVQLRVLQRSVTGASREVTLLQEELQGLRAQLTQLRHGASTQLAEPSLDNGAFLVFDKAPEVKLRYMRLQREVKIQNTLFTLLAQQLEQAKIEEAKDETAFQVLDPAIPPDKRVKPKRRQSVMLAMVVSAFLGVFLAFFREYLDSTIRTREQVERHVGVPVLGTIPSAKPLPRRRWRRQVPAAQEDLVQFQPPGAPSVEAVRYLHTRLKHRQEDQGVQTVLFTSASPREEIMTTLVNLAQVAANTGGKTLLVDSNLRQPTLHRLLACSLVPGLADILGDPQEWHKGVQTTAVDSLHLIPAGAATPASFAALESPAFDTLLAYGKETYDLILCTAPPVLSFSDAAVLSSKVDATCLILTRGVSHLEAVVEAKTALEAVQARFIGAILIA